MKNIGKRTRLRAAALLLCAVVLLFSAGCHRERVYPTDAFRQALDAELTVKTSSLTYRVTVHLGALTDGRRDAEVIYLSPDSLAGLTVRETAEGRTISLGDITIERDSADALLLAASLLAPAEVTGTATRTIDGLLTSLITLSDGRVVSVDADMGRILRIDAEAGSAEVEWMEVRG